MTHEPIIFLLPSIWNLGIQMRYEDIHQELGDGCSDENYRGLKTIKSLGKMPLPISKPGDCRVRFRLTSKGWVNWVVWLRKSHGNERYILWKHSQNHASYGNQHLMIDLGTSETLIWITESYINQLKSRRRKNNQTAAVLRWILQSRAWSKLSWDFLDGGNLPMSVGSTWLDIGFHSLQNICTPTIHGWVSRIDWWENVQGVYLGAETGAETRQFPVDSFNKSIRLDKSERTHCDAAIMGIAKRYLSKYSTPTSSTN